jgi:hypothetical protein
VAPDPVGSVGGVGRDVEEVGSVGRPARRVVGAGDLVGEVDTGVEVADPHREPLVSFHVDGVGETAMVGGDRRHADRAEVVTLGEGVDVEHELLGPVGRALHADVDRVLTALLGAGGVPPRPRGGPGRRGRSPAPAIGSPRRCAPAALRGGRSPARCGRSRPRGRRSRPDRLDAGARRSRPRSSRRGGTVRPVGDRHGGAMRSSWGSGSGVGIPPRLAARAARYPLGARSPHSGRSALVGRAPPPYRACHRADVALSGGDVCAVRDAADLPGLPHQGLRPHAGPVPLVAVEPGRGGRRRDGLRLHPARGAVHR